MKKINNKFLVYSDTRENPKFRWSFSPDKYCLGTEVHKLDTADYSIKGLTDIFCIERKKSTSEIATNLFEQRFENELIRLQGFKHRFIICEFTYDDLLSFPRGSGIPMALWGNLKATPNFLLARITNIQINYKIPFIMAGKQAKCVAYSIMKQVCRNEKVI